MDRLRNQALAFACQKMKGKILEKPLVREGMAVVVVVVVVVVVEEAELTVLVERCILV